MEKEEIKKQLETMANEGKSRLYCIGWLRKLKRKGEIEPNSLKELYDYSNSLTFPVNESNVDSIIKQM